MTHDIAHPATAQRTLLDSRALGIESLARTRESLLVVRHGCDARWSLVLGCGGLAFRKQRRAPPAPSPPPSSATPREPAAGAAATDESPQRHRCAAARPRATIGPRNPTLRRNRRPARPPAPRPRRPSGL